MEEGEVTRFESPEEFQASLHTEQNLRGVDVSGLDLSNIKLAGLDMRDVDFHDCDLTGARFAGLDMRGCNFSNAKLDNANLAGADLRGANLRGATMVKAKIAGVNLKEADFTGANLDNSILIGVDVAGADFTDVTTTGARATADWEKAKVPPAVLPDPITSSMPRWIPFAILGVLVLVGFMWWKRRKV
jgi:uncharacterized protein YjbI with pentapeptide repeats